MASSWQRLGENVVFMSSVAAVAWVLGGPLFQAEVRKVYAQDFEQIKQELKDKIDGIEARQDQNAEALDNLTNEVGKQGTKIENVDKQLDRIETQINTLTRSLLPRANAPEPWRQ